MPRVRAQGPGPGSDQVVGAVERHVERIFNVTVVPEVGGAPWTEEQFFDAFKALAFIRSKALMESDQGLRAWQTFGVGSGAAGAELLRGLIGTLSRLGPQPLHAVDGRHEKSLVYVLELLAELFQSPFVMDGGLTAEQKAVLQAKSQRMAAALVRSRSLDLLARLLAPDTGARFLSSESQLQFCTSLGDMLSWMFRLARRIQQDVNDGKYAAAHAAAQAAQAAAAASPSSSSGVSNRRAGISPTDDGALPELSPDGKRSVLAEEVVAAVQRSGILEHLSRAALRLACGQAPAHPDSCIPALEAIALCDPSAEADSSLGCMQASVLEALDAFTMAHTAIRGSASEEEQRQLQRPTNPFGACAQWYLAAHMLAQVAASELHDMMLPYRVAAVERALAPAAAAAARRAAAAAGGAGGSSAVLASVSDWTQANAMQHDAAGLSGLLEETVLNVNLYGLDADTALPRPVIEGCGGCKKVGCAAGVPLLRCSSILTTLQSWIRTATEPEAYTEPGAAAGSDSAAAPSQQKCHLIDTRGKIEMATRIGRTVLARWADSDERARVAAAARGAASAAGPSSSSSQPQPQQGQAAAPAAEPKRTRPLTQKELRQQAAAAKKAQVQAPKKGGGSGAGASASERARKETEEEQREKRKRAWLLGGFTPELCAQMALMSLVTSSTLHEFAVVRQVQASVKALEAQQKQRQLQQLSGAAGGVEMGGSCSGGGNAPQAAADPHGDAAPSSAAAAAVAIAGVDGMAQASAGAASARPPVPTYDLAAALPDPANLAWAGGRWWRDVNVCLWLLGRMVPGKDAKDVARGLANLLTNVLAGRNHIRKLLGEQEGDGAQQHADQVDAYLQAVQQAGLRRGLELGLVPALESLMRQLSKQLHEDCSIMADALLGVLPLWDCLEQLLQQASKAQAAALLVSLSKVAAEQFDAAMAMSTTAKGTFTALDKVRNMLATAAQLQLQGPDRALPSLLECALGRGADAAGEAQGDMRYQDTQRPAELLSLGLASWLPAARKMLNLLDALALAKFVALAKDDGWDALILTVEDLVYSVAEWVQVLVQAVLLARHNGEDLVAASWDAFLLRGVGAARLLRTCATLCSLGVVQRGGPWDRMVMRTAELLLASYPGVVDEASLPAWWRAGWQRQPPEVLEQLLSSDVTVGNAPAVTVTALVPPALVRNRLGVCANTGCSCLDGESEHDVPLPVVCGGCCAAKYCSQGCMEEHARDYDHTPQVCALMKEAAQAVAATAD